MGSDVATTTPHRITNSSSSSLHQLLPIISTLKSPSLAEIAQLWSHRMRSIRFKRLETPMERPLTLTNARLNLRVVSMTARIWCIDLTQQSESTGTGV